RLQPCDCTQFGGADRREILGMGEEQAPAIAEPLMKADRPLSRLGFEVRGGIAESEGHGLVLPKRNRAHGLQEGGFGSYPFLATEIVLDSLPESPDAQTCFA